MISRGGRLRWWLPFVSFLLLGSAWAVGLPLHGPPDEVDHIDRAAAVARGEIVARSGAYVNGTGGVVTAPTIFRVLGSANTCFAGHPEVPASCLVPGPASSQPTPVASGAARYFPLYYFLVGLPSLPFPNAFGWYAMRIVSLAVNAAIVAGAFAATAGLARGSLVRAGILTATTPMTYFLAGAVNVNSWEISGAIAVWVGGLVLLLAPPAGPALRTLVLWMMLSAVLMVTSRGLSPLWLALIGLVLLVAAPLPAVRAALDSRAVRAGLVVTLAATLVAIGWNQWQNALDIGHNAQAQYGLGYRLLEPVHLLTFRLQQMVGVFGWLDTPAPTLVYVAWTAVLGALSVLALAGGRRRLVLALALTAVLSILVPDLLEGMTANRFGFVWQGRYTLPIAVGVPLLAAFAAALDLPFDERRARSLAAWTAGLLAIGQVAAVWTMLVRFESGLGVTANPLVGSWRPPVGPLPVLLLAALGAAGLALAVVGPRVEAEGA